jgi:hypothetical protein
MVVMGDGDDGDGRWQRRRRRPMVVTPGEISTIIAAAATKPEGIPRGGETWPMGDDGDGRSGEATTTTMVAAAATVVMGDGGNGRWW